jgi:phosphatidylserine decarboxylase
MAKLLAAGMVGCVAFMFFRAFGMLHWVWLCGDGRKTFGSPDRIVSPADSKTIVYRNVDLARKVWIKNREFTIANMIGAGVKKGDVGKVKFIEAGDKKVDGSSEWTEEKSKEVGKRFEEGAVASFRLNVGVRWLDDHSRADVT